MKIKLINVHGPNSFILGAATRHPGLEQPRRGVRAALASLSEDQRGGSPIWCYRNRISTRPPLLC
jgi:hypothetical protein